MCIFIFSSKLVKVRDQNQNHKNFDRLITEGSMPRNLQMPPKKKNVKTKEIPVSTHARKTNSQWNKGLTSITHTITKNSQCQFP